MSVIESFFSDWTLLDIAQGVALVGVWLLWVLVMVNHAIQSQRARKAIHGRTSKR